MSFEESVIVPLSFYKKHLIPASQPKDTLMDGSLATDSKMKLYNQEFTRKKYNEVKRPVVNPTDTSPLPSTSFGERILLQLPSEDRPNVSALLNVIREHPTVVSWNDLDEVIVRGKVIPLSNIARIFQFFTRNLPVSSDEDVPLGASDVYQELLSLNVPKQWFKKRPPTRAPSRSRKRRRERRRSVDESAVWSSFSSR